jgi:hypothetical protein
MAIDWNQTDYRLLSHDIEDLCQSKQSSTTIAQVFAVCPHVTHLKCTPKITGTTQDYATKHFKLFDVSDGPRLKSSPLKSFVISRDQSSESKYDHIGEGIFLARVCLWLGDPDIYHEKQRKETKSE